MKIYIFIHLNKKVLNKKIVFIFPVWTIRTTWLQLQFLLTIIFLFKAYERKRPNLFQLIIKFKNIKYDKDSEYIKIQSFKI